LPGGVSPLPGGISVAPFGRKPYRRGGCRAPFPRHRPQTVPAVHPRCRACKNSTAVILTPDILLPRNVTVKGARCAHVADAMALRATLEQ
jgi:hypothetical protein